jgi:hypothetical protein
MAPATVLHKAPWADWAHGCIPNSSTQVWHDEGLGTHNLPAIKD